MKKIKITTTATISEKEMWALFDEQLEQIENDLIGLCEDNEVMKQSIGDYFERGRQESRFGRG
jgi:hypothetical protein